jgi:hypothetical protein
MLQLAMPKQLTPAREATSQSAKRRDTRKPRSDAFEAIQSAATSLHAVGAMDETTMRKFREAVPVNKNERLSSQELEAKAACIVGQMIFALSRLEMNMALYIRDYKGRDGAETVLRRLDGASFDKKLEMLKDVAATVFSHDEQCQRSFAHWIAEAHEIRTLRNDLVHGRWGIHEFKQQVVNVVGLPGRAQDEKRYSIVQLETVLFQLREISAKFHLLVETWRY